MTYGLVYYQTFPILDVRGTIRLPSAEISALRKLGNANDLGILKSCGGVSGRLTSSSRKKSCSNSIGSALLSVVTGVLGLLGTSNTTYWS